MFTGGPLSRSNASIVSASEFVSRTASNHDEDPNAAVSLTLRLRVLDGALKHVPLVGWTTAALTNAVTDLGLSVASVGMFPRGPVELVEHFITTCNTRLVRDLQSAPFVECERVLVSFLVFFGLVDWLIG